MIRKNTAHSYNMNASKQSRPDSGQVNSVEPCKVFHLKVLHLCSDLCSPLGEAAGAVPLRRVLPCWEPLQRLVRRHLPKTYLVSKAHGPLYQSTLGSRVIKKKKKKTYLVWTKSFHFFIAIGQELIRALTKFKLAGFPFTSPPLETAPEARTALPTGDIFSVDEFDPLE